MEGTIINKKDLERIKLTVGYGENKFSMSRGSFNYKQKFAWKQQLVMTGKTDLEDGYRLSFKDEAHDTVHEIDVLDRKDAIYVTYVGEAPANVNRFWLTFPTNPKEHIYGCGETYSEFDLKGQNVRIWVAEHQNAKRIGIKLIKEKIRGKRPAKTLPFEKYESYYVQPTFTSSDKYYVHAFINKYAEFDFTKPGEITLYTQEKPSFYSQSADSFEKLSEKLSGLLGKQKTLPDWLYEGGILAVQDWEIDEKNNTVSAGKGCDIIERKLEHARVAGAKVNGVWCQDWCGCRCTGFGYQVMWNWQYEPEKYPDLPNRIAKWKEEGVRFLGYINPFIALEKNLYEEASKKGYCVKDKDGKDYLVTITTFPAAMVDFTNPEAYEWYKNIIKENMIGIGMGGWMADFGEYLPVDAVLANGSDPALMHNMWPAIWAKLNYEAISECGKLGEVFFFTRAGHTNTIANSLMMWTGDQHVDWSVDDGLPSVIPASLSLAMSGYGITHSDVGGYTTVMHMTRSKELLLRWEEMNVFTPLFRSHEGNQPGRDVQFDDDEQLLAQVARCTKMHVALTDYIKEAVAAAVEKGTPVMRPLFYHYDEEPCYTEKTEYLFGRDILVAPIYKEGTDVREVFLPEDKWVHLFTGKEFGGGKALVAAPIGQPPVFVRKESNRFEEIMALANI